MGRLYCGSIADCQLPIADWNVGNRRLFFFNRQFEAGLADHVWEIEEWVGLIG
jgi:hypothetical protein